MGDFELHPGIGAEAGYHSNPFYSDRPRGTAVFRVAPHLFFSTLQAARETAGDTQEQRQGWVDFSGGLAGSFQHYDQYAVRDALNFDLSGNLTLAPERPVSFALTQSLRRSALPFSDTQLPAAARDSQRAGNYTNYYENAGAQLLFRTKGGLLRGGLSYHFGYIWFDGAGFRYNNNYTHSATLNVGWEFLPKTALFYDTTYKHQNFTNLSNSALAAMAINRLVNNDVITSRLGLNGAITSRIGATVAVGYTAGFYKTGDDPQGVIGTVEGRYTPTAQSQLALKFERGFLPSYQGNFQDRTRISARLRWIFSGAFLVNLETGISFLTFGYDAVQKSTRDDRRYFGDLSGEYRFVDWFALTGQLSFLIDDTSFVYHYDGVADPAFFNAVQAWLGVRAFL